MFITQTLEDMFGDTLGVKQGEPLIITDKYIPTHYDLGTYEGFRTLRKNHPQVAMGYIAYNNSRGQQAGRLIEGNAEYKRQILEWNQSKVDRANSVGGLRIFSFSDFVAVHALDLIQIVQDASAVGLKIQGYTKINSFARMVKDTGIKLNRSLIPTATGIKIVDGKKVLAFNTRDGIDPNSKDFFDSTDNPNVGNVIIGISEEQIRLAMESDLVDYIIPFHSNQARRLLEWKNVPRSWKNYKSVQLEKDATTKKNTKNSVNIYTDVIDKYGVQNEKQFVESFLQECKERNLIPRFSELLDKDADGNFVYTEGYYKLLLDFKLFDKQGNILPQNVVVPRFDSKFINQMLDDYTKGEATRKANSPKRDAVVNKFSEKLENGEIKQIVAQNIKDFRAKKSVLPSVFANPYFETTKIVPSTKRDADYMTAVESGDMKTAQRMVDEVAKENGYTPEHLYHGTNEFGFTSFDMGNSDDGISFFMSDKQSVSQGYMSYNNNSTDAYHNAPRRIGKKSDMKRTALSRTSSVDKVIDTLKKQFPYYAEARQATKSDVVSYLQKDISVNDAVSSANELLKLDVLSEVRALAESVVKASEDGSYNAWKNVADKYSEFDDVYDVTENIRQWNQALDLWDNIKRGVYTASDIVQEDSVYHNGKVESKSALIKRYNNSLQGESNGMYDLYANHSNQLVIEGNGGYWIDLPLGKMAQQYNDWWVNVKGNPALEGAIYTNGDTRSISEFAKAMGYHSVRFNNIYDSGASEGSGELSTVYSFFYPSQDIKSADPVTYDDDGNIIPPSQRFDDDKDDIRFATKRDVANNRKTRYNKRSYYSEFDSLAMQWRNEADTRVGDVNIVSGKGGFVLLEATEDGYVELAKGDWQTVKELKAEYERAYSNASDTLYGHIEKFRLEQRRNIRNMQPYENRGYDDRSGGQIGREEIQNESARSNEHDRKSDKEKSLIPSTKREMSVSEDASDYILDTKEYRDILKIVDQRYNLTNKKNLSPKAVERLAGKLLSNSKSKYDKGALTERLSALFDYMANSNELVWEDVMKAAAEISHDILSQSSSLDRSMQNQYKDTLDYLKGLTVYISPEVRAEIDSRYGSLENYRRMLGGKTKITVTDSSKMSLDSLWKELNEYHPEMFDADVSSLDQAEELMNFFDMTKPTYVNQFEYYWDMNEASYDFALQIYEEYFNIPEVVTESQRHKLEMERLKGKQNAKIAQIRKEYKDRIKRIRAEKNSKIEATKELYRERNRQYREKRNDTAEKQKLRRQIVRETKKLTDKLVN